MLCAFCLPLSAQRITRQYHNVSMADALKELNTLQNKYAVNFIYDDLEDFRVSTTVRGLSVPDAVSRIVGFYPIAVTQKGNVILVECTHKTEHHLTGRIIDEQGEAVPFANVLLLSPADSTVIAGGVSNESGVFVVPYETAKVIAKVSYVGYKTVYRTFTTEQAGTIRLQPEEYTIKKIIVKGERRTTILKDGSLITNVANTLLSSSTDMDELLQKIPGLLKQPGGSIVVLGAGKPEIYINKHKVASYGEISRLSPKDIKSIEVINTPGAKYSAETNAVVIIHTLRTTEGYWVETNLNQKYGFYPNYDWDVTLGQRHGNLTASAYYSLSKTKMRVNQPVDETIITETDTYHYTREQHDIRKGTLNNWQGNLEYVISEKQQVGVEYDGNYADGNSLRMTKLDYFHNNQFVKHSDIDNRELSTDLFQHLNLYHNGQWNKNLSSDLNIDYVYKNSPSNQTVAERSAQDEAVTVSHGRNRFHIYSARFNTDWQANKKLKFSAGLDGSLVRGGGYLDFGNQEFETSDYKQKEDRLAIYATLQTQVGDFSLKSGLRYEMVNSHYIDNLDTKGNVNRAYHDFFPSLTLSYSADEWSNTLTFTSQIIRPSFRQLSESNYYMSEFMYQVGNPLLKPTQRYRFQWTTQYKWLTLYAHYTYYKNYIDNGFNFQEDSPNIIISTYNNYRKNEILGVGASARKNLEWYYGMVQTALSCPFFNTEYLGETVHFRKPQFTLVTSHIFKLPKSFTIDLYYMYCNGGNRSYISFDPYQNLTLSIKKTVLHNRLTITLKANDILRQLKYTENMKIGRLSFRQTEDYQQWYFGINIKYQFNKRKDFKSNSSAQSEIERL